MPAFTAKNKNMTSMTSDQYFLGTHHKSGFIDTIRDSG